MPPSMSMSTSNDVYRYVLMHKCDMGEETYDHVTPPFTVSPKARTGSSPEFDGFSSIPLCKKNYLVGHCVCINTSISILYEILLSRI